MKKLIVTAFLAVGTAVPAAAEGAMLDPSVVQSCHAMTRIGAAEILCLGQAASMCQDASTAGTTTPGIAACITAETAVWDDILNAEYGKTQSYMTQLDATEPPVLGARPDALRKAQRAWIAYRDAECGLTYLRWQGGSIRSIAAANCGLIMTARRAFELRDMRGDGG